jgi:tRNA pseudouridine32 synthase/23S rRNA pseudouridine746 synthase/23S rRNA pseudouridine1911/1915/1917 synthase
MFTPTPPRIPARHRPRGFVILHEDRDLLVIDKEPGVLTMSFHDDDTSSVAYLLTRYLRKGGARSGHEAWVVHRLDRETSGLLVFAKSQKAQQTLKDNWPSTEKLYIAAVHGKLKEKSGELTSYLAENDDQFVHSVHNPDRGRPARTAYTVIKETADLSLLRINLLTGRKNQIRVQFAELGHPVAGDPKYGKKDRYGQRMALHARILAFHHPHSGERVIFTTPIPDYFKQLARGLSEAEWSAAPLPGLT